MMVAYKGTQGKWVGGSCRDIFAPSFGFHWFSSFLALALEGFLILISFSFFYQHAIYAYYLKTWDSSLFILFRLLDGMW